MAPVQHGRPLRVLVTAFGGFPGVPRNPTLRLLAHTERQRQHLARLGIELHTRALAVRYGELAGCLRAASAEIAPDVIVLLGVAARRRRVSVETRALNFAHPLRPDAAKRCPPRVLVPGGPAVLKATWPAARIRAAIGAAGVPVHLSRDAGAYVCNAALYHALYAGLAPCVGFLHVPKPAPAGRPAGRRRPCEADLQRAVMATLRAARIQLWSGRQ